MSVLDPERVMRSLEDRTIEQVKSFFPLDGRKHSLVVNKVYAGKDVDVDDITSQKKARIRGRTWATPIYGDFELKDKVTGDTIDVVKKVRVLSLPKLTRRYSYIIDGTEYQADNQWRLKSGVYTRQKVNGEIETQFNLSKGRGFRMDFSPEKRKFLMKYGTTNVQLLPVLRALGISDNKIETALGPKLFNHLAAAKDRGDLVKLAKALDKRADVTTNEDAIGVIKATYAETELNSDTTKLTLGKGFSSVTGAALLSAASRLLGVARGTQEVDNRDSLQFKELWSIDDHIPERLANSSRRILGKLKNNLDRKENVRGIVTSDIFGIPIKAFFTSTTLTQQPTQLNPTDMVGGFLRTTVMGTGGIQSDQAISDEAKMIDASHLGFIDPVHTPEGARSGVSLHLTLGVSKRGKEPTIKVFDTKKKKYVSKSPTELALGNVAFSDEYKIEKGKDPVPKRDIITIVPTGGGDPAQVAVGEVDYILQSPKSMFSMTANLVPFLPSDQAGRAGMATRHLEQAIALKNRQAPVVQVSSGNDDARFNTWEKIMGMLVSHKSPVAGTVVAISGNKITVEDKKGEKQDVQIYENFPLNDKKAFITAKAIVKVGDKVTNGQVLADTNFTKGGVLALGTNMRVAYVPYKGLVFEDGIVISETAAKNLTSEHLHKNRAYVEKNMQVGLRKFRANYPGAITEENANKLDEDGVIKKGQIVRPGDTVMAILQKSEPSREQLLLRGIHKSLARPYKNKSIVWQKPYSGVVTDVSRNGREIVAYIRTEEPADIGDKLTGRHGNKGVITAVLPDREMPKDKDGKPIEVILNPSGVPGRINPGQVLETVLAKVALKTGEPYAVSNFETNNSKKIVQVKGHFRNVKTKDGKKQIWIAPHDREIGYQEIIKGILDHHDIDETEELFDPETGKSLGKVMVGTQYVLKMCHQVDKKLTARAHGYGFEYDSNMTPKSGGDQGAQQFGELGLYAMLAHGATANIRDATTFKGDKTQDDVWTAVQTGQMLPTPKPSFAYEKFLAYLNALGVNVTKEGNGLVVSPLTDKEVVDLSNGEITDGSRVIRGKDLKPEKGGLFDEEATGGPGGKNWAHIKLAQDVPNPLYEKSILSLLGMTGKAYDGIIAGTLGVNAAGEVGEIGAESMTGFAAIVALLGGINVKKDLAKAEEDMKTARKSKLDKLNKKIKYLRMLDKNNLSAKEAYVLGNIPVIPPLFRPITMMEGGDLNIDGLNMLYRDIALLNKKLKESKDTLPEEQLVKLRADLYDSLDALMGTAPSSQSETTMDGQPRPPGILTILSGRNSPKQSFFHKRLLNRKQDLSMRSVIIPDMDLHLDEVGIPRKGAMRIFRPFVVKELVRMGYTPLRAREEIDKKSSIAMRALDVAAGKRPVLFKRDPVLHKFGVLAFKPVLHDGYSIRIHPLVTGGFNADFDGDAMAIFVPVSQEAVDEAYKMMPSKNLFNPATGRVMYQPSLEGQLGLFLMSQFGKKTNKSYDNEKAAAKAAADGNISFTDVIKVGGITTTAGRLAFVKTLPADVKTQQYLTDPSFVLGKKNLQNVMRRMAKETPAEFSSSIDKIKDLGFGYAYNIGFSFSMDDFNTLGKLRDKHLAVADKEVRKARASGMSKAALEKRIVSLYSTATTNINTEAKKVLGEKGNKLYTMNLAGVKPSWSQVQQLLLSPMLVQNAKGRVIPVPIRNSYSEGLSSSGYWVAASGARKGLIEKVQSVQIPGALSKQLVNSTIRYVVTEDDCGTSRGIALDVADNDMIDRFTAKAVKLGTTTLPANTAITPNLISRFKAAKQSKIVVRSALKCQSAKGLCGKCYGIQDNGSPITKGTNIGVIAGQAIGERGTQLSMKAFHTGGVAGAASATVGGIDRVVQLMKIPKTLPGKATISTMNGTVSSVLKSPVGGFDVKIGDTEHYVPAGRAMRVKVGAKIKKGDPLSSGVIDPRELLEQTNIDVVQRYISSEVHKVYANEGVRKRNIEVVVKAITNLGVVTDPGDSDKLVRGDYASISYVNGLNRTSKTANPVKVTPILRGVETLPLDQTTDWVARLQYRKLKETYTRAANEGWTSQLHGTHPVPGIAYAAEFGKKKTEDSPY
jgi:DNA-directed RNA polymerase beta subunit/DNA-directed RNA polymerase beta' subunit